MKPSGATTPTAHSEQNWMGFMMPAQFVVGMEWNSAAEVQEYGGMA